jgi:C1A family cysteine protease
MAAATSPFQSDGRIKDPFDPRDHYYTPNPTTLPPNSVNLRQDYAQLTSDIYDQLKTNSCTANATAAAFWYEEKIGRREGTWGNRGPSRLFIYWLARGAYKSETLHIRHPYDTGSCVRDAMRGIAKCGVCSEDDWPFDVNAINDQPSDEAVKKAAPHTINTFYRLDPDRPDEDKHNLTGQDKDKVGTLVLDNLKKCPAEQYPVVFGLWYYLPIQDSFDQSQTPFVLKDVWVLSKPKFPRHTFPQDLPEELRIKNKAGDFVSPGHTILAIGYDDEKQAVLIQNSLGPTWGGNGTFWMPYSWITDFAATNDFWTIRSSISSPDTSPKKWDEIHREILSTS